MKKIIITLALCSAMLGMASCTRGGNIDRGNGGYIGKDHDRREEVTDAHDTDRDERKYHNGIADDIYHIPHDVRRGIDDAGDGIRNGLDNAEWNLRHGMNLGGTTPNNYNVIK